ncbi:hypothetical protein IscW_ISCW012851, partial [Ixodes scapularis]
EQPRRGEGERALAPRFLARTRHHRTTERRASTDARRSSGATQLSGDPRALPGESTGEPAPTTAQAGAGRVQNLLQRAPGRGRGERPHYETSVEGKQIEKLRGPRRSACERGASPEGFVHSARGRSAFGARRWLGGACAAMKGKEIQGGLFAARRGAASLKRLFRAYLESANNTRASRRGA